MTLQDLWLMIKHYSRWVILVPIICGVLAGGAGALLGMVNGSVHTAASTLTVIDPTGLVSSTSLANLVNVFAQDQAELESGGDSGVTVKTEVDSSTQSIKFEVAAPSEQTSLDVAREDSGCGAECPGRTGHRIHGGCRRDGQRTSHRRGYLYKHGRNSRWKGCCFALMFLLGIFGDKS